MLKYTMKLLTQTLGTANYRSLAHASASLRLDGLCLFAMNDGIN